MGSQVVNTVNAGERGMLGAHVAATTEQIAGLRKHGLKVIFSLPVVALALFLSGTSMMRLVDCIVEYGDPIDVIANVVVIVVSYYVIKGVAKRTM